MTPVDIRIPQMGEGLQEALVLALLKPPGSHVDKDEPVFEMETDKARVSVEAACAGLLREWLVREGDVVPIGAIIGRIEPAAEVSPETALHGHGAAAREASGAPQKVTRVESASPSVRIPPRTRAHARALGIADDELRQIQSTSGKLLPADLDRYVTGRARGNAAEMPDGCLERRLTAQQRALTFRFRRSAQLVVPATIMSAIAWSSVERALQVARTAHPDVPISVLELMAYAVAQGAGAHPNFRSTLLGDDRVREYPHVNLGIAVHRPGGDLVTAAVPRADTMALPEIARGVQATVASALEGRDQTDGTTQIVLTILSMSVVTHAVPTLVAPAVATLFVGAPAKSSAGTTASLCLTFDHRLVNGSEAADFLEAVADAVNRLGTEANILNTGQTCEEASQAPTQEMKASIDPEPGHGQIRQLTALVRDHVVDLLRVPLKMSDVRRPLRSLGMKSVTAVALSKALARDLGQDVPATLVWNYPTIDAIARHLAVSLGPDAGPLSAPDLPTEDDQELERLLKEVEGLSDSEARRLLGAQEKPEDHQSS